MVKVITYGTYDLLHYGHIRLLERAKALGDYLIVGVTADDFDKARGKINVQQSLSERIEAVRNAGIADEIIVEEYEGQKIDDIRRFDIDIFTVGSDWEGMFDYLKEYCKVVYLPRTEGISSSEIRQEQHQLRLGLVGYDSFINKVAVEASLVNGIEISGICSKDLSMLSDKVKTLDLVTEDYDKLLAVSDAVYIHSHPKSHFEEIRRALEQGKHVLCESPLALKKDECNMLFECARQNNCVLIEALKTAYSTAYYRLLLLVKSGIIGKVISIDATCTSLKKRNAYIDGKGDGVWNSLSAWGPTALLPVFQILGTEYDDYSISSLTDSNDDDFDIFTKISFEYPNAVASVKVGNGIKSEGELVISGTTGYIYVPSPWWKTDYFEVRYENPVNNKRFFYQLEGEGIRYELASFARAVEQSKENIYISESTSIEISKIMEAYYSGRNVRWLS